MNVLSQLRQKRIVQIILSYLAVGWAILEVADQLSDRGVVPDVTYSVVLILVVCGVFAAALIGWHHGEKGKQQAPRSEVAALIVLAVIGLASSGFVVKRDIGAKRLRNAEEHPLELRSVAVMYFKDYTDDPELAYIADGLTEELVHALSTVGDLDVRSTNATAPFRGADPPIDSVAQVLSVGTVVNGSVERRGRNLEVSLELVDGRSGAVVERSKIKRPADELLAVRDSVVEQAANLLRQWIGKEVRLRAAETGTSVREAWALVQRAENARKAAEAAVRANGPNAGEARFSEALSNLAQAEKLDPKWVEPVVQRAAIMYRRARLAASSDVNGAVKLIEAGLQETEAALALSSQEARALELRGTLKYFQWLLNVTPDSKQRAELVKSARGDLETAVRIDPSLASAHSTLSHLLYNDDISSAMVEARLAYEKDAYLEVAPDVVWRLFYGNFDLGNFTQSEEWCRKGQARFQDDFRFAFCELRLLASPALEADPARAWELAALIDSLVPAPRRPFEHLRSEILVGGVLARASLKDSADHVLMRARNAATPDIDPSFDLPAFEAAARLLNGQPDMAFELLRKVALANPDQGFVRGEPIPWVYAGLRNHPRLNELYTQ